MRVLRLWLIAFSFDRREVVESLCRAQKQGASTLLVLDRKQTLQGPAEQQRVALQAAALGVKVVLANGNSLGEQYELAGRGRSMTGMLGVCHAKSCLCWHWNCQRLDVLTGSADFTTSSRANREWAFRLSFDTDSTLAHEISGWAEEIAGSSVSLDAGRMSNARSQRAHLQVQLERLRVFCCLPFHTRSASSECGFVVWRPF